MFFIRPHERHDLRITTTTKALTSFLPLFLSLASFVGATPLEYDKRDTNDNQQQPLSPKIWVPVLVIIIVLFALGMGAWRRYTWDQTRSLLSFSNGNRTQNTAPREITAAQLAGTINGDNQTPNAPTRRTRRPRRTPSQMSVTSLPAYNKEPGEEELVIFRGRDAEDATMPAARAITSMEEEREEDEQYSPIPNSPNSTPLLQDDDAQGDLSMQSLAVPPGEDMPRPSYDTSSGSHETSSLIHADNSMPDPRGEAPPYFEVVDQIDAQGNNAEPTPAHARTPSSPGNNTSNPRRSGFRTLLNRMSMAGHPQFGHNRNESTSSTFSSNMSHGHEGTLHRSTPSGSGSLLSVSMFRTLSRQRSNHTLNSNRLNSPSLISLNSISAPLTHTLTRTEFTYPKSGPTPEQLKVISSRDTFTRFGVPYGPDAVAFAASSSRQDLMIPPPGFEEVTSSEQSPRSVGSANPSRLRSSSNAAQLAEASSSSSPSSSHSSSNGDLMNQSSQTSTNNDVSLPQAESATTQAAISSPTNEAPASVPSVQSSSISKSHSSVSSSKSIQKSDSESVSEFGKLTVPLPSSSTNSTVSSVRSDSRVSVFSNQSYATAAESVAQRSARRASAMSSASFTVTDTDDDGEETEYESQPSTPRLGGQHQLEPTDATIVPRDDRRDTVVVSSAVASVMSSQQQ